jgi:AraC-like DNA-binding protein
MDLNELRALMKLKPTLADTAIAMGCSEDTIQRFIKDVEGLTFREFRAKYMAPTRLKLQQRALDMAMAGSATMLTYCLKSFGSWLDDGDGHDGKKATYSDSTIMFFPRSPAETDEEYQYRKADAEKQIGKNIIAIAFDPDDMHL